MSEHLDIKSHDVQNEKALPHVDDSSNLDVHAKIEAYKAAAMAAEVEEQKSGVLQAVREYPMAATWAFVMSCTIVSPFPVHLLAGL
jgi:SP family general alpha glucoside:H+ symporter-like MFS transporter